MFLLFTYNSTSRSDDQVSNQQRQIHRDFFRPTRNGQAPDSAHLVHFIGVTMLTDVPKSDIWCLGIQSKGWKFRSFLC